MIFGGARNGADDAFALLDWEKLKAENHQNYIVLVPRSVFDEGLNGLKNLYIQYIYTPRHMMTI